MRTWWGMVAGVVLVLAGCAEEKPAPLPTAEELSEMIAAKEAELTSYAADMHTTLSTGSGTLEMRDTVTRWFCRTDGKVVVKTHLQGTVRRRSKAGRMMQVRRRIVNDGVNLWTEETLPSRRVQVTQQRADAAEEAPGPGVGTLHAWFDAYRKRYRLEVTGRAQIDGEDCIVLEGTAAESKHRMRLYTTQATLTPRRLERFDAEGKPTLRTDITNVRLNPSVGETLFTYTPPPGAKVRNLSGQ